MDEGEGVNLCEVFRAREVAATRFSLDDTFANYPLNVLTRETFNVSFVSVSIVCNLEVATVHFHLDDTLRVLSMPTKRVKERSVSISYRK